MNIPYFRPTIGPDEVSEVIAVLNSGWLTTGSKVSEFEKNFAQSVNGQYALAVNSCTAALHLALDALGLRPGQRVLLPTLTFAATAEVVAHLGAEPVLVDCNEETLSMDLADLEAKLCLSHSQTAQGPIVGIIVMHYGGRMVDMDAVNKIAKANGLWVVEDAAHAFPAAYYSTERARLVKCGESSSDITCFSFYANKTITTGEGGMAVTASADLHQRMKTMSLHGLSHDAWNRYGGGTWDYKITAMGYKYNMTDVAAAIGLQQLKKAEALCKLRHRIADAYIGGLVAPGLRTPSPEQPGISSWHLFPIRLPTELRHLRNEFIRFLKDAGIGTSVHWRPLHEHPYYLDRDSGIASRCPVATREWRRLISLPIFPGMADREVQWVIKHVLETLEKLGNSITARRSA